MSTENLAFYRWIELKAHCLFHFNVCQIVCCLWLVATEKKNVNNWKTVSVVEQWFASSVCHGFLLVAQIDEFGVAALQRWLAFPEKAKGENVNGSVMVKGRSGNYFLLFIFIYFIFFFFHASAP